MAGKCLLTIDGKQVKTETGKTVLEVCRENAIDIPTLCYVEGLEKVGACRLCVVEVEGSSKLFPSCTTQVQEGQAIHTTSEKLEKYRRMIVEMLFSERNHVCAVCVANNNCDLQKLGYRVGMDHVRFPYLFQNCSVDATHEDYVIDHNRCILCTRCVRVCDEIEAAHNWDVMGRGYESRIISDFNQPWGESTTCTSCGKCVDVCPTGALWPKKATLGNLNKDTDYLTELVDKRKAKV
jgi:bidirectional [NiFe] hydrogenase diaphorase subunit